MHRQALRSLLGHYLEAHPDEDATVSRVQRLIDEHEDCFTRTCLPGHITASCWIVSPDAKKFLLTHHRKLGRWLQLGGHADGDPDVAAVALREAREESGLQDFDWITSADGLLPLDIDVHTIPARGPEPAHEHHDIRFLLRAHPGQRLQISEESLDLRWFDRAGVKPLLSDPSLRRLYTKAQTRFLAYPRDVAEGSPAAARETTD